MKTQKQFIIFALLLLTVPQIFAQDLYWVFFKDKNNTSFNPYEYFDAKAIERYRLNNADLYDLSNYPLNSSYSTQVSALAGEEVGESRWLNALAVMATPEQKAQIEKLPFVKGVQIIATRMQMCSVGESFPELPESNEWISNGDVLNLKKVSPSAQITRMNANAFRDANIDGKGVRVAVFDGGFPAVNTHPAFSHLRNNNQIIKTWNFPKRKENVYGWNSHGTMVLSCVAGVFDTLQLGLATGAEFLLARTEVNTEPFKEEVWWMQAVEWADKNGADVINSSLGYGKDRYFTKDMDGTSYVARAANLAARKGIVVCNSAGNEGTDKSWYTIITPADADSVIAVGGISSSLYSTYHINFSSFGPTADGRMKPNVANFGTVTAANPSSEGVRSVDGTSFSSPLTAGFVACVRQAHPSLTSMQVKDLVEHSAELYPYADYAFGYGVPQADYIVEKEHKAHKPSFRIEELADSVLIRFFPSDTTLPTYQHQTMFISFQNNNTGKLSYFANWEVEDDTPVAIIEKEYLYNHTLHILREGYYQKFTLSQQENERLFKNGIFPVNYDEAVTMKKGRYYPMDITTLEDIVPSEDRSLRESYYQLGSFVNVLSDEQKTLLPSLSFNWGTNYMVQLTKGYMLGIGAGVNISQYRFNPKEENVNDILTNATQEDRKFAKLNTLGLTMDAFQRVRLIPGGSLTHKGLFWDLGVFGGLQYTSYKVKHSHEVFASVGFEKEKYRLHGYEYYWGVLTRLGWDVFSVYAKYNVMGNTPMNNFRNIEDYSSLEGKNTILPRLEVGIEIQF